MDEYDYNDSDSDEYDDEEYKLLNYMPYVYDEIDKFYLSIDKIWNDVFVPYIESSNEHQILTKLTENDKHKFVQFMVTNSKSHKKLLKICDRSDILVDKMLAIKKHNDEQKLIDNNTNSYKPNKKTFNTINFNELIYE